MNDQEFYYWGKMANEARTNALKDLRASGENWAKILTALLGVTALVGVTLNPTTWDDRSLKVFGSELTELGPLLLLAIFIALAGATWWAYRASQDDPKRVTLDPVSYRQYYADASQTAYDRLKLFHRWLLASAILVGAYTLITLLSKSVPPTTLFEVTAEQGVFCGTLSEGEQGKLIVTTPGKATRSDLTITAVTPVKDCFKRPLPD